LFQFHLLEVSRRTGARQFKSPDHIAPQGIQCRFLASSARNRQRSVPGQEVESAPAVNNHGCGPAVLRPRYRSLLGVLLVQFFRREVRIDAPSSTGWVNDDVSYTHQQRLRLLDYRSGLVDRRCNNARTQFVEQPAALADVCRLHAKLLEYRDVFGVVNNAESLLADSI